MARILSFFLLSGEGALVAIETQVGTYSNPKQYQRDAARLAKNGWVPVSVVERRPRAGCLRIITLGLWTIVFPPKPELVVTYQRGQLSAAPTINVLAASYPAPAAGASYCPTCGSIRGHGDAFCAACGFAYNALPAPAPTMQVAAYSVSSDDPYGDTPNPYNIDPETGLPYMSPGQQARSKQISKFVMWGLLALLVIAILVSIF